MGKQTDYIQKILEEWFSGELEQPIIVEYEDGTTIELPPYKDILEEQLELSKLADFWIDKLQTGESLPPFEIEFHED